MLTVTKNTELRFLTELQRCLEQEPTQRCAYFRFSEARLEKNWFDAFLLQWGIFFSSEKARIFLFHDNDVMVLMRTLTQKKIDEFLTHLDSKLSPAPMSPGLASLFEVRFEWPQLKSVCTNKILRQKSSEQTQKKQTKTQKIDISGHLDHDLIASIDQRRKTRKESYILVVEDDPFSQKLVENSLKNNYLFSISRDGCGAIMSYITNAPDIIFLDIGLPDIDGLDVLRKLFEFDPDAFVVMFSGNGHKENVLKAVELGAKGFLGKPFTQEKLFQYISKSPFIQKKSKIKDHSYADTLH